MIEVFCVLFFLAFISKAENDSTVTALLEKVSGDSIWENVDTLTTFERFTKESDAIASTNFLRTLLESYSYDIVETQNYKIDHIPNVYAVKEGTLFPETYLLIGAHYDVYTAGADGADDNGSGSGALMEIARVLSTYSFEKSIILAFYSGEEINLLGSKHFADSAINNSVDLESIINLDVIGYLKNGTDLEFDCSYNSQSKYLYDTLKSLCSTYLPEVGIVKANTKTFWESSDHKSFWNQNIPGLFFAEELNRYSSDFNYNWHTDNDIMGVSCNSKILMESVAKAAILLTVNSAIIADESSVLTEQSGKYHSPGIQLLSPTKLSVTSQQSGMGAFSLLTVQGRTITQWKAPLTAGSNTITLDKGIASGVYLLRFTMDTHESVVPLILNR